MRSGRWKIVLFAVTLSVIAAPAAMAATPQQIFRDIADNGRLDARYSRADLEAARRSALLQGYPGPTQGQVEAAIQSAIRGQGVAQRGALPFTGLDLALLVGVGLTLLLFGAGLRRLNPKRSRR